MFQVTIIDTQFLLRGRSNGLMAAVSKLGLSQQFTALLYNQTPAFKQHLNSIFLLSEPMSRATRKAFFKKRQWFKSYEAVVKLSNYILHDLVTPGIHGAIIYSRHPQEMLSLLFKDLRGMI